MNSPDNCAIWPDRNRDAIGERNPHRGKRQDQFAHLQISALETIFGKRYGENEITGFGLRDAVSFMVDQDFCRTAPSSRTEFAMR